MAEVKAQAKTSVDAPAETVLALIRDTTRRHELLPEAYHDVSVAGDVVSYRLHAGGRQRDYVMRQVATDTGLREQDETSSLVTVWTVTPGSGRTDVTITTTWQGAGGIGGFFEKTFAPKGVAKLHTQTLGNVGRLTTGS